MDMPKFLVNFLGQGRRICDLTQRGDWSLPEAARVILTYKRVMCDWMRDKSPDSTDLRMFFAKVQRYADNNSTDGPIRTIPGSVVYIRSGIQGGYHHDSDLRDAWDKVEIQVEQRMEMAPSSSPKREDLHDTAKDIADFIDANLGETGETIAQRVLGQRQSEHVRRIYREKLVPLKYWNARTLKKNGLPYPYPPDPKKPGYYPPQESM